MLITKRILTAILYDKSTKCPDKVFGGYDPGEASIIEVQHPVVTVHKDRFALWTEADDDLYMLGDHEAWGELPYDGIPIQTKIFETTDEIRAELTGKKIFLYVDGTEHSIASTIYAGFEPKGFVMRYAIWEPNE